MSSVTEEGRQIDKSAEHPDKRHIWTTESFEPYSKSNASIEEHRQKQHLSIFATDKGRQNAESAGHIEKARGPIEESLDPDSNVHSSRNSARQSK
jgi:hypothetical protein